MGLGAAAFLPQLAFAQGNAAEEQVEEVVVTGSRIARDQFTGPTPVVSVDSEAIKSQGFTSTQDILNSLTQNTGGSLTQQETFGFTPAASGIDLRGAGLGRSLTLIDGLRVPSYPVGAGGTITFTDTANIPIGAIERVEVLTSGASAIYGADAMGGVINIIMKDDFEGVEFSVRASDTDEGGRATQTASMIAGTTSDKSSTMFFIEYENKEDLFANQRKNFDIGDDFAFDNQWGSYSSYGAALRSFSGLPVKTLSPEECTARGMQPWDIIPGTNICGFNRTNYRHLFPEQDRLSTMLRNRFDFTDDISLKTTLNYTRSNVHKEIEAMPIDEYTFYVENGMVEAISDRSGSNAFLDQATAFDGDFADLPDGGYYYTRRAIEYGPRTEDYKTDNFRFATELDGKLFDDHDWQLGWNWGRQAVDTNSPGYASAESFFRYIIGETNGANGNSLLKPISASDLAATRYNPTANDESTLTGAYLSFQGDIAEAPAGTVKYAAGIETYKEYFTRDADEASKNNEILSTGASGGAGTRTWDSAYGEILIPVFDSVEVTGAVRYDDYSDFGDSTVFQFAVEWRPIDPLLLRASWGETFRAPDLARVYGDPVFGFQQITDPQGCAAAGGSIGPGSSIAACNGELYIDSNSGANPDLDAETGESWNVGAVFEFEFAGDWQFSADWWHINIDDIVNEIDAQTIANDPDTYGNLITRNPTTGFIEVINATAQNLSFLESEGIDFALSYSIDTAIGQWVFKTNSTYMLTYDDQFTADDPVVDYLEEGSIPEWKANFTVNWYMDSFYATAFVTYLGEMEGINARFFDPGDIIGGETVDDQWRFNLSGGWDITDNWSVQLGVNNVTDEGPNEDPTETGWPEYNQSYYDALGREYYGRITLRF
ncbi:TonB-dependent receptor [Haliea sp. E17]|uniref:TonB-dependent receptor n=1 Tax=Haliea sp. E17 TaxID=3401576 RepID=UPI003AAE0E2B